MASIINETNGKSIEVKDGKDIRMACEDLDIFFGCVDGICGTCMVDITEGSENLTPLTQAEKDLERDQDHRLACQCRINGGLVKLKYEPN